MRINSQLRLGICILVTILAFVTASGIRTYRVNAQSSDPAQMCTILLQSASQVTQDHCTNTDRNEACYGYNAVTASYQSNIDAAAFPFLNVGDIIPIGILQTIQTHPLNITDKTWGIALLKLQVDLPDTNPGQNVTFLLIGDSRINNTSGNMHVFYFSTGLGQPSCNNAPDSGLMVRVPHGLKVSFQANGVQVSLASTAILRAVPYQQMTVTLIEGHGQIAAHGVTRLLPAGSQISIPLGGSNGLQSVGPPSPAYPVAYDMTFDQIINMADQIERKYAQMHALATLVSPFTPLPGSASVPNSNGRTAPGNGAGSTVANGNLTGNNPSNSAGGSPGDSGGNNNPAKGDKGGKGSDQGGKKGD